VLTPEGFAHALALGSFLWATLGWRGWTVCVIYLTLGSAVTKIKFEEKKKMGIEEKREGRRGPENVWGSAFTGLVCAACASQGTNILGLNSSLFVLAYITSLATKLSDTFASEVGKAYGKTTFLITTLERVSKTASSYSQKHNGSLVTFLFAPSNRYHQEQKELFHLKAPQLH